MSEPPHPRADVDRHPLHVDPRSARPERLHSYLAGGDSHFAPDRELAVRLGMLSNEDVSRGRSGVRALGAFMGRSVRYLVGEAGIRQLLHPGSGLPTGNSAHDVAQAIAPDVRVVYSSSDPLAVAHAHEIKSTPEGAAALVYGSLRRQPDDVLKEAAETLDFSEPVGILLLGYLNFVPDKRDPYGLVERLLDTVVSGSYLAIAHTTADFNVTMHNVAERLSGTIGGPFVVRTHAEVSQFFDGLELVEPGVVHIDAWFGHQNNPVPEAERIVGMYGAVARKP